MTTSERRNAVKAFCEVGVSERQSCRIIGISRATLRHRSCRKDDHALRDRIRAIAHERRRFGYRRIAVLLNRIGGNTNHKRVYRIYCEENLQVRKRGKKKVRQPRKPLEQAIRPNERWSLDFVSDSLANSRRFRTLNVVDDFTRECLAIEVDHSLSGSRVTRVLDRLAFTRGKPDYIVMDNGPELTSRAMLAWCTAVNVIPEYIRPGKPIENAFVESFNGKFRDECLNENTFLDLASARSVIEHWREDYNASRPHSSLGYVTPQEFFDRWNQQAVSA